MEAQIFAYFAVRSLQNKPLSVPGTTGVPHPTSGGRTYYPSKNLFCFLILWKWSANWHPIRWKNFRSFLDS